MIKLSIIIPVYNVKPYLERCLDSVEVQDGVEVIIVDDGATDGSAEICDRYASKQVKVIHKKNGGCCSARNAGMEIARGKYITHLDGDDEYMPGAVGTMLRLLDTHTEDLIQFNFTKHQNGQDKVIGSCKDRAYVLNALPSWWVVVWNKLYKRTFIEEHRLRFNEGMKYDDDAHFNLQCFRHLPTVYGASDVLVRYYCDNAGSITNNVNKEKFINATIETVKLLREDNPPIAEKLIRERIVFKWTSKQYVEIFGGE